MSHLKGKKRAALRSIIFLSAIILTFTVADLFNEERFFSESENRILAEKPTLCKEALLSGKYMEDYESYLNDQFVSRDIWIRLKTGMDMLMQKKLSLENTRYMWDARTCGLIRIEKSIFNLENASRRKMG